MLKQISPFLSLVAMAAVALGLALDADAKQKHSAVRGQVVEVSEMTFSSSRPKARTLMRSSPCRPTMRRRSRLTARTRPLLTFSQECT